MIRRPAFRTTQELRLQAEAILREHHPEGTLPVPIELIVEAGFGIDVIPVRGFKSGTDAEGGLSGDLSGILVDEWTVENRPTRYRFTLAHELSHYVLHRDQIEALEPEDVSSWKSAIQSIGPDVYETMEWQAYELAGLILVPRVPLKIEYDRAIALLRDREIKIENLGQAARDSIAGGIGKAFQVSSGVITRRLRREDLPL